MPTENGRIFSQYLNNGTYLGADLEEVARTILCNTLDVGTVCRWPNINGLSRYRPVRWNFPSESNMQINQVNHTAHLYWMENTSEGTPWIYGQGFDSGYRTIVAPEINMTFDQLVDSEGNLNSATKWTFNLPPVGEIAHLSHFHGYNHKAGPSIYGKVAGGLANGYLSETKGTLKVGLGSIVSPTNSYYSLRKEDGCWAPSELLKILNFPKEAYIGVAVRNRRVTTQTGDRWRYSMGTAGKITFDTIGSGSNAYCAADVTSYWSSGIFEFALKLATDKLPFRQAGTNGGVYQEIYSGDVIDVVVFLSKTEIASTHSMTAPRIQGISMYINSLYRPVKTFTIVDSTATVSRLDVQYQYSINVPVQRSTGSVSLGRTVYMRIGDNVYAFDSVVKGVRFPSGSSSPLAISLINYADYPSGLTDVSVYTEYQMQVSGEIFYLPTATTRVDFKAYNGTYRMGWSPTRIQIYLTLNDAVHDYIANATYLDDFMRTQLGMSTSAIESNGGYLPVYFSDAWNIYNNDNLRAIPPAVEKVIVGVSCRPLWDVDEEFVREIYNGKVSYYGAESNRVVFD